MTPVRLGIAAVRSGGSTHTELLVGGIIVGIVFVVIFVGWWRSTRK